MKFHSNAFRNEINICMKKIYDDNKDNKNQNEMNYTAFFFDNQKTNQMKIIKAN